MSIMHETHDSRTCICCLAAEGKIAELTQELSNYIALQPSDVIAKLHAQVAELTREREADEQHFNKVWDEAVEARRELFKLRRHRLRPKLIGWRTDNYLWETSDPVQAKNWEPHHNILPIFEGDPNTKLTTPITPATELRHRRPMTPAEDDQLNDMLNGGPDDNL